MKRRPLCGTRASGGENFPGHRAGASLKPVMALPFGHCGW